MIVAQWLDELVYLQGPGFDAYSLQNICSSKNTGFRSTCKNRGGNVLGNAALAASWKTWSQKFAISGKVCVWQLFSNFIRKSKINRTGQHCFCWLVLSRSDPIKKYQHRVSFYWWNWPIKEAKIGHVTDLICHYQRRVRFRDRILLIGWVLDCWEPLNV